MYLSVSAQFTLKDKPKGYLGLCGEHLSWGRVRHISLSGLACSVLTQILDWHTRWLAADEMNAELQKVIDFCQGLTFYDAEVEAAASEKMP